MGASCLLDWLLDDITLFKAQTLLIKHHHFNGVWTNDNINWNVQLYKEQV